MTIAILTLSPAPAHNYGGILQSYALQNTLTKLGFDSLIFDMRKVATNKSLTKRILSFLSKSYRYLILNDPNIPSPFHRHYKLDKEQSIIYRNTIDFVHKYLQITDKIKPKQIGEIHTSYDTYIVGSDQVWRPRYSPYIPHFFLDFIKTKTDIKRIAYAASFGVDTNEFSEEEVTTCKSLASKFDAISVREESGIRLCKELFNVDAIQVLDPTLLLDAEHYKKLSYERNDFKNDGDLFTYVLDENTEKQNIISEIEKITKLKPFRVLPKNKFVDVGPKHIEDCILPSVEQWLRAFIDAQYVVTDSFHGTVFSILFQKPFITIGNSTRGMARFTSLLKLFDLENRLVFKSKDITEEIVQKPIDYNKVRTILQRERIKSKEFLLKALGFKTSINEFLKK